MTPSEKSSVHSYREQSNNQPLVIFTFFGAVTPQCVGSGGNFQVTLNAFTSRISQIFIRLMFLFQKGISERDEDATKTLQYNQ